MNDATHDITIWLSELGLVQYAQAFLDNGVDCDLLAEITNDDLKDIGVDRLADRKRILKAIEGLAGDRDAPAAEAGKHPQAATTSVELERRQLSVMFVDLVGSTALSARIDPEDLREVMRGYQDAVAGAVTRYGGHVAKYLGDGVLAYFGWPKAHEDQAERAVRAGLDAVEAVGRRKLEDGTTLRARAGIATGQVVIGDLLGERGAVSGETPNLAARLQETAAPGQVAISDATRLLIAETFELDDLGKKDLKGFDEPHGAWRVTGERAVASRFEAVRGSSLTPFVGREHEIGLLFDRWKQATSGEGQVVMLTGEAGIGKSRIAQTLREHVAEGPHIRIRYQCSPYFANTALHPFIRQLERAAGFTADDSGASKLEKIRRLVTGAPDLVAETVPIFAALLSLPTGEGDGQPDLTPQQLKERTIETLCNQAIALAHRDPVLIIFEDVHWADPTTLEALEVLIQRIQGSRVLAVITARPEFAPPWHGYSHVTALMLNRLGGEHCASIVANVTGGKALPAEVLGQIIDKADGVPLFVEELTKAVVESGLLAGPETRRAPAGSPPPLAIPSTLQDSLMARLDRVPSVKALAQIGAAIGREFSFPLVAAVSSLDESVLAATLSQLVESEIVFQRGAPPDALYIFKHALLQDTAYASLTKSHRRQLHRQIAEALERSVAGPRAPEPELIAHHLTNAGLGNRALPYWQQAGERALSRFANREAVVHFTKALEMLEDLPKGRDRDALELSIRLRLGPALQGTKGFAAIETRETYIRARELCERVGETAQRFAATWGLWLMNQQSAGYEVAEQLSQELIDVAERQDSIDFRLQAHHSAWTSLLPRGEPARCFEHARQGIALYDRDAHRDHAYIYGGHDPGVCGRAHGGMSSWLLGFPDRALSFVREGIALAEELEQPFSQMVALNFGSFVHQFRGDVEAVRGFADRAVALGEKHNVLQHSAVARIMRGWALITGGATTAGFDEIERALTQYRATGAQFRVSYYLGMLAEGCLAAAEFERGLQALTEAEAIVAKIGEHWWLADIWRLRGEILAASGAGREMVEQSFRDAQQCAREQKAQSLELRAAISLARTMAETGRRSEARAELAPVLKRFTEGFDTADLTRAKALLEEL